MSSAVEIDVIILSYALTEELKKITVQCVQSLIDSEDSDKIKFNIIVIESNKALCPYQFKDTTTKYPDVKFGYHRYMNIGIGLTKSPYICICNNDLFFHKKWATELLTTFEEYPDLSSVSPLCSLQHPGKGFTANSGVYFGYEIRKEVSGWCILFKREILNTIGKLDEKFKFYYADNDYALTLQKYGLKHALVTSSIVDHLESQTLVVHNEMEQKKLTAKEQFYFQYKWGQRSYLSYLNRIFKFNRKMLKGKVKSLFKSN